MSDFDLKAGEMRFHRPKVDKVQTHKLSADTLRALQARLATLVLPSSPQVAVAAEYLENLGSLWTHATLAEQRDITRVMLKAVYVDLQAGQIVAIELHPIFRLILAEVCGGVGVAIL